MTRLCVPILVRNADQARRDAVVAIELGADMIELRLDAALDAELLEADDSGDIPARDHEQDRQERRGEQEGRRTQCIQAPACAVTFVQPCRH